MDSRDTPSGDAAAPVPETADILRRPDLKRTLKDLLVQDEVSDSDVEMLEKHSTPDEKADSEDVVDPEMCVECGDQVCLSCWCCRLTSREPQCTARTAKNSSAKSVITISSTEQASGKHIHTLYYTRKNRCIHRPPKSIYQQ